MAEFIAIDAKADLLNSKKGKMTPAQHAQINAWTLTKKTGIFDWGGKCEAEYQEYNASGSEDRVTVKFKGGYLSVCGRIIECQAGASIDVPLKKGSGLDDTGHIVLQCRLGASGKDEFKLVAKSGTALTKEDLNEYPQNGVYEFSLYGYSASQTKVTLSQRNASDYISSVEGNFNNILGFGKPLYEYDENKGTIEDRLAYAEERLTKLGFKKGALTFCGISYAPSDNTTLLDATQGIFRHGNYVVGVLVFSKSLTATDVSSYFNVGKTPFGVIPEEFRPAKDVTFYITGTENDGYKARTFSITIKKDGTSSVNTQIATGGVQFGVTYNWNILFGYEANPIE